MPPYLLTIHHFSETSNVVQKCRLRRLISENTRKTTSRMTLLASRKMEKLSRIVFCVWKPWPTAIQKPFQLKQHLNNAHKEQTSKSIEYLSLKKVVSKASGWIHELHFTKQIFLSLRHPMWLHFALLKRNGLIPLQTQWNHAPWIALN